MVDLLVYIFMFVVLLLPFAGYWRLFDKAGERGWKVLIPVYNLFVFLNIIRRPKWWITLYILVFFLILFYPQLYLITIFIMIIDSWRCHTLFGKNIAFYNKISNLSRKTIFSLFFLPYKIGRMLISMFFGFPNISFNRKALYSLEHLNKSSIVKKVIKKNILTAKIMNQNTKNIIRWLNHLEYLYFLIV